MAYAEVTLSNGIRTKIAPVGFSWTVFFFAIFPPAFRGDWKWFIIIALLNCISFGFAGMVVAFFYNRIYINELLQEGYVFQTTPNLTDEQLKIYLKNVNIPRA